MDTVITLIEINNRMDNLESGLCLIIGMLIALIALIVYLNIK
jgi:hypothetical protein